MATNDPTEKLLRRVETRAMVREDLLTVLRALLGTIAIFGAIVALLLAVVIGAILFATVMNIVAG